MPYETTNVTPGRSDTVGAIAHTLGWVLMILGGFVLTGITLVSIFDRVGLQPQGALWLLGFGYCLAPLVGWDLRRLGVARMGGAPRPQYRGIAKLGRVIGWLLWRGGMAVAMFNAILLLAALKTQPAPAYVPPSLKDTGIVQLQSDMQQHVRQSRIVSAGMPALLGLGLAIGGWFIRYWASRRPETAALNVPTSTLPSLTRRRRWIAASATLLILAGALAIWIWKPGGSGEHKGNQEIALKVPGKELPILKDRGHHWPVFLPNGKEVITAYGFEARKWNINDGAITVRFRGHTAEVGHIALSDDGSRLMTTSYDKSMRLWDVKTGDLLHTYQDVSAMSVAFSPDGRSVVAATGEAFARNRRMSLCLWDLESQNQVSQVQTDAQYISSLFFLPDGRRICFVQERKLEIWDLRAKARLRSREIPSLCEAFVRDRHRIITCEMDGSFRILDVETGQELHRVTSTGYRNRIRASADGGIVVTEEPVGDRRQFVNLRIWQMPTGRLLWEFANIAPASGDDGIGEINDIAISPDGRTAVAPFGNRGSVRIFQLPVP